MTISSYLKKYTMRRGLLFFIYHHMDCTNDNLTFNLNHKIRFRLSFPGIIYTRLMLIELM
jgi:hypothetical protein